MSLIDEKNIEDLKNYPDCKNCIHYCCIKKKKFAQKKGYKMMNFLIMYVMNLKKFKL